MYVPATHGGRLLRHSTVLLAASLAVASCAEPPGDPMVSLQQWRETHPNAEADRPQLIRAEPWHGVPAAPIAEIRRAEDPRRHRLALAASLGLLEIAGSDLADRVRAAVPDLELTVTATSDRDAIDLVRVGRQDAALVLGELSPRDVQSGLRQVWLGSEVFALAVSAANPVANVSGGQLRGVLCGHLNTWTKLGGSAGAVQLVLPQSPERLERMAQVFLPGDRLATRNLRVASDQEAFEQLRRVPGGASLIALTAEPRPDDVRLLSVDKVPPMVETFAVGTYPYGRKLVLITEGEPGDLAAKLLEYLQTPEGKEPFARSLVVF
jgi:hypothetical protein